MSDCAVFTQQWLESLKKRHESTPGFSRPFLLRMATDEHFATTRQEIEDWITCWEGAARTRMIRHLQDPKQFRHAYHELAVDSLLRKAGVIPLYEERVAGVTPDFLIPGILVVEVMTLDFSEHEIARLKQEQDLIHRIRKIRFGYMFRIRADYRAATLSPQTNKRIVAHLDSWLAAGERQPGERLELSGIRLEIMKKSPQATVGILHPLSPGRWGGPPNLKDHVKEKSNKYKHIGLPLAIVVVPTEGAAIGIDDLLNVIEGQEAVEIVSDEAGNIISNTSVRQPGGLRDHLPETTVGIVCVDKLLGAWRSSVLRLQASILASRPDVEAVLQKLQSQ